MTEQGRASAGPSTTSVPLPIETDRPSFDGAAPPDEARRLYEEVVRELRTAGLTVATGEFQAMMRVQLENDGPVTILVDSRRAF